MEINAGDLRKYYASLSIAELRNVDPRELSPVGLECFQHEMARRGVKPGEAPVEELGEEEEAEEYLEEAGEMELAEVEEDWVEHAACPLSYYASPGTKHAEDAELAREVLLAAGIPCELETVPPDPNDENSSRYDEYRVLVPDSLNLWALSVLDVEIFNPQMEDEWRAHLAQLPEEQLELLRPEVICAGMLDRAARLKRAYQDEVAARKQ